MKKIPLCIDGHEDMAWNKIVFNRDYSEDVMTTRSREAGTDAPKHNGDTLLGWDAYQQGCIGLIFSTLFAAPIRRKMGDWDFLCYRDAEEAHKIYQQQVDVYQEYAERYPEKFVLVTDKAALQQVIAPWLADAECKQQHKIGLVILMENAEGVREPAELEQWWQWGVRIIGPAWAGTRFCGGTREPGPLTKEGYALLDAMADLGFALDVSHMDEEAVLQSLDHYDGTIVASHANVKALMKGTSSNRFLSDRVIEGLVERDAVIGVVPYNLFLQMGWKRGDEKSQVPICGWWNILTISARLPGIRRMWPLAPMLTAVWAGSMYRQR